MEISKKDIECKEIVEKIERLTSSVRQFIRLVNSGLPKELKLNKENFIIEKQECTAYLNDGNTRCAGFSYQIFWSYTPQNAKVAKEDITRLTQKSAITFVLECEERCCDHAKVRLHFFSLYYKSHNSEEHAERIEYISDNYEENYLFKPYEIMQVVWRIRKDINICPSNISEDYEAFEKFARKFEDEEFTLEADEDFAKISEEVTGETLSRIKEFQRLAHKFAIIVNCYCAVSSKKVGYEDLKKFMFEGEHMPELFTAMDCFASKKVSNVRGKEVYPITFLWQKDRHNTFHDNERLNEFSLYNCIKSIIGYSYFNEYVFMQGIEENWHPRLLYFSYYISKEEKCYYTITMTGCQKRFQNNDIQVIQAETIDELFTPANAIKVAKWLEEIWEKTALINNYSSQIEQKKIRNFNTSRRID